MVSSLSASIVQHLNAVLAQAANEAAAPAESAARGSMGYDLTAILIFTLFGIAFVVGTVSLLSRIARPAAMPEDEPSKGETYECGEPAVGTSWVRFDIRFYTVALVFLIFDVEVAFLFPWAAIFRDLREASYGSFLFLEMLIFIIILLAGFVYCWKKGDLDWIKATDAHVSRKSSEPESTEPQDDNAEAEVAQAA